MSARAEFGPLTWEETEQNRRESDGHHGGCRSVRLTTNGDHLSFRVPLRRPPAGSRAQKHWNSLLKRRDRLRNEIEQGKEYLEQVRRSVAASRAQMEEWPEYENRCGKNPLPQLVQEISVNERIAQFLRDWLERHEQRLAATTKEIELAANQNGSEPERVMPQL